MPKRKSAPRKKQPNRLISGCLVLVTLVVIAGLFGSGSKKSTGSTTTASPTRVTEQFASKTPDTARIAEATPVVAQSRAGSTPTDTTLVRYDSAIKFYVSGTMPIVGRGCARLDCPALAQLQPHTLIFVEGQTEGEAIDSNITWYQTTYNRKTIYINSSFLSQTLPEDTALNSTATITDTPASVVSGNSGDGEVFRYQTERTMYVNKSGTVNARSCPRTTCSIITRLSGYSAVQANGETTGELVNNSTLWYQIISSGQTAYVHSSLLSTEKPATPLPRQTQPPIQFVATLAPDLVISTPIPIQPPITNGGGWAPVCSGNVYNCADLTCDQISIYAATCAGDPSDLDGNKDGQYCESKC